MSRTYSKRTCRCGKEVSANGAAWHSHMMGHVRKGEAKRVESPDLLRHPGLPYFEFRWVGK